MAAIVALPPPRTTCLPGGGAAATPNRDFWAACIRNAQLPTLPTSFHIHSLHSLGVVVLLIAASTTVCSAALLVSTPKEISVTQRHVASPACCLARCGRGGLGASKAAEPQGRRATERRSGRC